MSNELILLSFDPKTRGKQIRALRERTGKPQYTAAVAAGISPSTITRLERGDEIGPTVKNLVGYLDAIDCDVEIYVRRREDQTPEVTNEPADQPIHSE